MNGLGWDQKYLTNLPWATNRDMYATNMNPLSLVGNSSPQLTEVMVGHVLVLQNTIINTMMDKNLLKWNKKTVTTPSIPCIMLINQI